MEPDWNVPDHFPESWAQPKPQPVTTPFQRIELPRKSFATAPTLATLDTSTGEILPSAPPIDWNDVGARCIRLAEVFAFMVALAVAISVGTD